MSGNVFNQTPFLITSRSFPETLKDLSIETDKSYIDTANVVNMRQIGIFTSNKPAPSGEQWFYDKARKQQGFRQIYFFTTTANIPHGINVGFISRFTHCYGSWTDGTNWYGLIFGSSVTIAGQLSFYVTPTDIVFLSGAGVPVPLVSGIVVLEWISNV